MKKIITNREEIKLIGITARTNNTHMFEADIATNAIAATVHRYMHQNLAEQIPNRKNPGAIFCVYTNYESDFTGEYTYFIGEEVTSFAGVNEDFTTITIPAQKYCKFTNQPGPMPNVCIDMWKAIWRMSPADLGGSRAYIADFEIYDERSSDHNNATFDIYIGIKG